MLFQTSNTENMDCPISTRLEARSVPMVKGCPGIPRSVPRIETVLNIRSINDSPFVIRTVKIQLVTRQTVLVPTKFGSNEATKELVIYEDPMAFQPPMGKFSQKLHGLDIPILIPIPRDITPSGHSPTFGATTLHYFVVLVSLGKDLASELTFVDSFPVDIKMYDTLPIYRQYNEPIVETNKSSDNQVLVEATVPYTSVGPKDNLSVLCLLKTNAANNKVKKHITLKQLTFQVKEVIECYDAGLPPKREFKLHTESKYYTKELSSQGIIQSFQIQFPYENDYLEMFSPLPEIDTEAEVTEDFATTIIESTNISKLKTIDRLPEGVPVTNIQGFTLLGKFYSIWFEIVIKVKLSHAKDMNIHIPIIVSPFDKEASKHLLDWIMLECEIAKAQFGKEFNRTYSSTTKYSI
ncbi:Arrestin family protein 1 [Candida viswanathii]|uniref:Arrestin family protein 1 n=1 Tax=Candida viswanathii TaxID=5486 RepID=A0A367XNV3_9ASCO|nr:Arrestin family protein 1 [Candida viswanathii]